jgi:phosphoglycerate dehydrogenase-like enzyme
VNSPVVTVPDERWLGLWPAGEEPVEVHLWDMTSPTSLEPVLVVPPYMGTTEVLPRLAEVPSLRLVQLLSAGYENVLPHLPEGVTLASGTGIHDTSTAELAVGLAIGALRGFPDFVRAAEHGSWASSTRPALADRRVLVLGVGGIGSAIIARLAAFEVSVTRVGTRARDDEHGHVHAVEELAGLLPRHEVVILATPLTESTRGLVDAEFLAAMPDGALLVNVSRGAVVVTDALLAELSTGRLLAGLDVTDPEPLPPDHPLWQAPGVLISPHVGGDTTAFPPRARALLKDQFERFAAGRELRNVVRPAPS